MGKAFSSEVLLCNQELGREIDKSDYRIRHIAQHDVEPDEVWEVWEVCEDSWHLARRQGHSRYRVYGQTADGRYLFAVLEHIKGTVYKPITARDMTDREKRNFRRLRR